jgi:hypothetical protein
VLEAATVCVNIHRRRGNKYRCREESSLYVSMAERTECKEFWRRVDICELWQAERILQGVWRQYM